MLQRILFSLLLLVSLPLRAADAPHVVVTIAPLHSLVVGVMAGVAEPDLLIKGASSPHGYMLKPSQLESLQRADLVVWSGESIESFLPRTLRSLSSNTQVMKLAALPGMVLLPSRSGGIWGEEEEEHHDHHEGGVDGHLWLDPENARAIVKAVSEALTKIDSSHAAIYSHNSEALLHRLDQLSQELDRQLTPVRNAPYLVFHDSYHYFEARYHLNAAGAISVDPERKPGARRLHELTSMVQQRQVRCVFSEPQFPSSTVRAIISGSSVKSGVLDPLGSTLQPGEDLYFDLMRALAKSLVSCLQDS